MPPTVSSGTITTSSRDCGHRMPSNLDINLRILDVFTFKLIYAPVV